MLSYKQWRTLNESFAGSFTLGLAQPTNLGVTSNLALDMEECKMAKKKSKKKMSGDESDGEMVDPAAAKDDPDVDVDMDADSDVGGDDACHNCGKNAKKNMKKMKKMKKMWSDADDDAGGVGGEDDVKDGDELDAEGDGDEVAGDDPDMPAPKGKGGDAPMFSKKASKKAMKKEAYLDDDAEWMASVKNMLDPQQTTRKYDDGFTRYYGEDALFTPVDTDNLTQAIRPEPQAGEVGFAPQQSLGGPLGGYQEWAKKHK